jgi:aminopeptidase N
VLAINKSSVVAATEDWAQKFGPALSITDPLAGQGFPRRGNFPILDGRCRWALIHIAALYSRSVSLTLSEARSRADQLSDIAYGVDLDLTDPAGPTFGSRTTVRFRSTAPETFLELSHATALRVSVDGRPAAAAYDGKRITLTGLTTGPTVNEIVVEARLPYVTDGDGMHTFTDPADRETYVSAYVGMDIAQRVFACFDQNDLKASIDLSVTADPAWTVLANGRALGGEDGRWRFATTPPIPVAMFVVCAGPWHSVTWEHAGIPFGWHARRSLATELDRDIDDLRAATVACFDHYAGLFTEPYAFDSYDQAFVPGQNWGAMESPGCVTYRDELLPRGRLTDLMRTRRSAIVAHEMAHMWFGNLVTMTWWEDTWLQESFADYMGYRVAGDAVGEHGSLLNFEIARKPGAYDADLRRSTHPVAPAAEEVPDVDTAANNFDSISYAKGNSSIRQLVTWLGDETFLAGVNAYLARHRFGNATLADFITALDETSHRDVSAWAEGWLRQSGFDTIRVSRDGGVPVLTREGSRPHRVRVTAYDDELTEIESRFVDVADVPVRLDDWAGRVVVPNSHGETFARLKLDEHSWAMVLDCLSRVDDGLVRAVLWTSAFGLVRSRELAPGDYLQLVARHLPAEREVAIVSAVLNRTLGMVIPHRLPAERAGAALDVVAAACRAGLTATDDEQVRIELTRGLARSGREVDTLREWLADGHTGGGVDLDPALRWTVVHRLAELGGLGVDAIEAERQGDGTIEGELGAATALAALPQRAAKAIAWTDVVEHDQLSNRMLHALCAGLWSLEQADLVAPYVAAYLAEAPRLAERGQAFAQEVSRAFPAVALDQEQLRLFESALAGDLPSALRRGWEDHLDDLR